MARDWFGGGSSRQDIADPWLDQVDKLAQSGGGSSTFAQILAASNDAGAHQIKNLGAPTAQTDAATRGYIDTVTASTQGVNAYTLALSDLGTVVEFTAAGPVTVTLPSDATANFPVGGHVELFQAGAGLVSVAPDTGVTIESDGNVLSSAGQYSTIIARKRASNTWVVGGELASTAVDKSILTTKGDIIIATAASSPARLGVGSDGSVLRADSTQAGGARWQRPKGDLELQLAALGLCTASFHPAMVAAASSPSSQSAYLIRVPLRQGMQITGLQVLIGTAAVGAAPSIYVGLADTNGVVLVQSGNTSGTLWTATGFLTIPFGSTYTVTADGSYYAFILVNGTWATTQPQLQRLGGTMIDDIRVDARQGGLTAPPANGASFTPSNSAVLHFWVGCVGS